ncbi:MAG: hypothetical protein ACT4P3_21760 [Betaproteobacteria bacterium]
MKKFCNALLAVACLLLVSTPALADCTLGHKSCRNGSLWVCERCGSETCWIFKGTRCLKDDDTDSLPVETGNSRLARELLAGEPTEARPLPLADRRQEARR